MAATNHAATANVSTDCTPGHSRAQLSHTHVARVIANAVFAIASGLLLLLAAAPALANPTDKVRITGLSDVAFGSIVNLGADASRTQSICLYSGSSTNGYNVTATGSGSGGAFQLTSGSLSMPFEVQWSSSAAQSSGTQLNPSTPLTGQVSTATQQTCSSGPAASASLIVVLRSSALSSAAAGTYAGSLTLLIGPE